MFKESILLADNFVILFLLIFFILVSPIVFKLFLKNKKKTENQPKTNTKNNKAKIHPKRPISAPEKILFYRLKKALPGMEILPQVAFNRFLYTKGGTNRENHSKFLTFSQKSIDFLVCDSSFFIKAAIELDDSSHTPEKDAKKNKILQESGIRLIRWHVKSIPSESEIKYSLLNP